MDTDSIICNYQGFTNLQKADYIDDSILGKLKIEKKLLLF